MSHISLAQIETSVAFSILFAVMTFLAIAAFQSLRRMDDTVLKARLYMNRRLLSRGFLAIALSMIVLLAVIIAQLALYAADAILPGPAGIVGLGLSFGLLGVALYNFYALVRTPRGESREAA